MTPGDRLKKLRIQRGWSQQEIAEKVFVTNRTISNWEHNKREISHNQLLAIAKAFDVNVQHFYHDQSIPQSGQVSSITVRSFKTYPKLLGLFYVATCVQYGLLLIPFSSPLYVTLLSFVGWFGLASVMGTHWMNAQKKNTQTWLFPIHQHIVYESSHPEAYHRRMRWFFSGGLIAFFLPLFLYYGSWFEMLQSLATEGALITIVSLGFLVLLMTQCVLLIRSLANHAFAARYDAHAFSTMSRLRFMRMWVWGQLSMIIGLLIFSLNWPFALFPIELLTLRFVNEAFLLLYLPSFYERIVRYYASYHLIAPNFNNP
jgi:transcriptional regulator with XRE-family HTH domain